MSVQIYSSGVCTASRGVCTASSGVRTDSRNVRFECRCSLLQVLFMPTISHCKLVQLFQ